MLLLTAVYAATAFFRLGNTAGPQTYTVVQSGDSYSFSYSQPVTVDKLSYFTVLGTGSYELEYSLDGKDWDSVTLTQAYSQLLKWVVNDQNASEEGEDAAQAIGGSAGGRMCRFAAPRPACSEAPSS